MERAIRLAAAFVALAGAAFAGAAGDWPHLRGPTLNGLSTETGIADQWPEGGPPVLWRIRLGQGYSGFIAVGDRLYTQAQSLAGQFVVCLDADTGRVLWRTTYDWPWEPEGHWPGPMATPTFRAPGAGDGSGRLYFAGTFGLVGCMDAERGRLLWSLNVTRRFEGQGTEMGYACSPLVEGARVFLPVGGEGASVVALDARDGSVAWRSGDEPASYSSPCPITVGGKRQIVAFLRNVLVGLDPATGRQLWLHRWSESYDEHASMPVYEEPYLLTCAAFRGGARVLRLKPDAPPGLVWQSKELSNDIFSSLILDGRIYGFDLHDLQPRETRAAKGRFKCIELATGKLLWSTDRTGHANVLAADGKLILLNDLGELILARARPDRYEELCRARVLSGPVCWTAPTLHRGRLYVRNQDQAACIYLGDPAELPAGARPVAGSGCPAAACLPDAEGGRLRESWTGPSLYAPEVADVLRWYGFCLSVFAASGAIGFAAAMAFRRRAAFGVAFFFGIFILGALGAVGFSYATRRFVFTWPASVFAAYQATVYAALRAKGGGRAAAWASRAVTLAFICLCVAYLYLCRSQYVPMGYGYLVGILPAVPVAWLGARRMIARSRPLDDLLWTTVSFSVYFWASGLFTVWKTGT